MEFAGQVCVVTGAGSGIGRSAALALAAHGAAVALIGRSATNIQAVANEVLAAGGKAIALTCDTSRPDEVAAAAACAVPVAALTWARLPRSQALQNG